VIRGLNLGCGTKLMPSAGGDDWVNTDLVSTRAGVWIWDLENLPWPWDDGQFSLVLAEDVFEHISPRGVCGFMGECWRVLEPGGELRLRVPHWQEPNMAIDPTHYRGCHEQTFDYWTIGTVLFERHNTAYGGARFSQLSCDHEGYDLAFRLEALA